ncbi:uncharacterized protein LOC131929837 [Physella acuta]|uniref:uncharacterized protein LOC131929837 n=1 Tax=Physella acuta TaxID=109671 RepID=UPI0027DE237E|nr:uncharacterized protein LOC131929837 [Physella acuta]
MLFQCLKYYQDLNKLGANLIVLGDFNLPADDEVFTDIWKSEFTNCILAFHPTNISINKPHGDYNRDNIWIRKQNRLCYKYNSAVLRNGLDCETCQCYISDHCPVYADVCIKEKKDKE